MHEPFDMTTIIFALLAIFVVWKLSSVLGMRTGNEKPPVDPFARRPQQDGPKREEVRRDIPEKEGNVIRLPGAANDDRRAPDVQPVVPDRWRGYAEPGTPLWISLDTLAKADPSFDPKGFLEGAKAAYEMIINAFTNGDEGVLQGLLSPDVFGNFSKAIADRKARGESVSTILVAIEKAIIDHVDVENGTARIGVTYNVKLISATRDSSGTIIDGSPDKVSDVTDLWTFARDIRSRDPNWRLVATETRH